MKYNNASKYDAVCFGRIVSQFNMTTFLKTGFIMSAELIMYGKNKTIIYFFYLRLFDNNLVW